MVERFWALVEGSEIALTLFVALVQALSAFALIALVSSRLRFVVGLKSPPTRRALLTTAPAYGVVSCLLVANGWDSFTPMVPLAALPAALIIFCYWRADFRCDWFERPDLIPADRQPANTDWRVGVLESVVDSLPR